MHQGSSLKESKVNFIVIKRHYFPLGNIGWHAHTHTQTHSYVPNNNLMRELGINHNIFFNSNKIVTQV